MSLPPPLTSTLTAPFLGTGSASALRNAHLNLSSAAKSKPPALVAATSMQQHQSVAAAGTTAASGCTTFRLASSSRYSHPSPSTPAVRAYVSHCAFLILGPKKTMISESGSESIVNTCFRRCLCPDTQSENSGAVLPAQCRPSRQWM